MNTYEAYVTREGKWWMVTIPELGGLTQARRLTEAPLMAREYIAVTKDVPLESVAVHMTVDTIGNVSGIQDALDTIRTDRERAKALEQEAQETAARLALGLVNEGVPLRDVGAVMGISHQRVQQLVSG